MQFLTSELLSIEQKGLKRALRCAEGAQGRAITIDGKQVLNFCSNNYLGLAGDERLKQAAIRCLEEEGFGAGASRLVCGNMTAHRRLEKRLAEFKGTDDCLVFSTGYMANVGIISSVCGRGDLILADKLNHASIIDGIRLSGAAFQRYPHLDMAALERLLKESGIYRKKLIITDSVFSMDGDVAPLERIVALAKQYQAMVMVDEAHAFGVLGKNGKGAVEHFGLEGQIDIQMGTLSKAAGAFGAYCCGSQELIQYLINRARSFIYTTGMPPAVAAAARAAVDIIEGEPRRREYLNNAAEQLRGELRQAGFDTGNSETPIIPVIVGDPAVAVEFSRRLFEKGIFVQAIRPPTVPQNTARLRVTVMATHTREDLDLLLEQVRDVGKELGVV
jgi:glycine C-acetyltransferase